MHGSVRNGLIDQAAFYSIIFSNMNKKISVLLLR